MRFARVIFIGSVAAGLVVPALAKHPEAQKTEDDGKSTSSSCYAYRQAADGSWTQLPCQEFGNGQTQHRPVAKGSEEEAR